MISIIQIHNFFMIQTPINKLNRFAILQYMRSTILIVVIFCLFFNQINSQTPPSWGGNPRYTVKVKMQNDDPAVNWTFTYYYDWTLKAQRYEHQAPQQDQVCLLPQTSFVTGGIPCTVTFSSDTWMYISFPTKNYCCKCSKSFGSVRYDWLQANSSYVGIETVEGRSVTHWTKQGQYLNNYYSTVDKQLPVKFFEIKNGNPKSWVFDLNSYDTGPIDPSKFAAPCSNMCSGYCSQLVNNQNNLQVAQK